MLSATGLATDGFAIVPGVLAAAECERLAANVASAVSAGAGSRRLLTQDWCRTLAQHLRGSEKLAGLVPALYVAAQCTYFSKSSSHNWLVPMHQDLSIPVAERVSAPVLRGWSEKEGELFVQPPVEVLERLIAVRIHLDPCTEADGPLQVVPRSHESGAIALNEAAEVRRSRGSVACTLNSGDALVLRPLLLHASSKASGSSMRRVLHFLFGPPELPHGLRWLHAV
jgi:ectoine hydroxylase-related dioxygenase (phytanoyl-CoA dioxygenase family)